MKPFPLPRLIAASLLALMASAAAFAQGAWPEKTIHVIAPFAPGGPLDIAARTIAPKLSEALGQPVVVDNISGAGSTLGIARLAQSAPDGYTIALGHVGSLSMGPHLFSNVGYDPRKSFAPITMLGDYANVLVVNAKAPYQTVADLLKAAREHPGAVTYGSAGVGSSNHLSGALLASKTGVQMTHVPYRGSAPAMNDLVAGQITMMFDVLLNSMPQIKAGAIRPLAVTNQTGLSALPGVPPLSRTAPGYEVVGWVGLVAPAGTPEPVVERLHGAMVKIMQMPDVVAAYANIGFDVKTSTPQELQARIDKDYDLWGPVIKAAGVKAD